MPITLGKLVLFYFSIPAGQRLALASRVIVGDRWGAIKPPSTEFSGLRFGRGEGVRAIGLRFSRQTKLLRTISDSPRSA
ncbi:hypothetical protein [Egbenema bharatensis]|uniref:hypothetical protein n=1 Tax=Egbenema bharatensis TaxID=3463334 RepID=UPI003A854301